MASKTQPILISTIFTGISLLSIGAPTQVSSQSASGVCPTVGDSGGCGVVITITNTGGGVLPTGIGPYDGIEDTLIGVVNNSTTAIKSINLTGTMQIFGFDGDGIDTYGVSGNSSDGTGYGGPNAYFSGISSDLMSATVNFITPIPPNGSAYFSLEGAPTATCNSILNNSVPKPPSGGTSASTKFTPQQGYTLAQAAQLCGFADWDFQQTITNLPKPSPFCAKGSLLCNPATFIGHFFTLSAPAAFNDPPTPHGYSYQDPSICAQRDKNTGSCLQYYQSDDPNNLPLYFNPNLPKSNEWSLLYDFGQRTDSSLYWFDSPADPCLPGAVTTTSYCYGGYAPFGSKFAFTTHLVGLQGTAPNYTIVDTGIGFDWYSTFNGTTGGISVTSSPYPVDLGSGTGGITVVNYNGIATLTGTSVTAINGVPTGPQGSMPLPTLTAKLREPFTPCNGTYGGTFKGDIFVGPGESCTFEKATVTGNILVDGGVITLQGVDVSGNVNVIGGGSFSLGGNTAVEGSLIVENAFQSWWRGSNGMMTSQICSATVYGDLVVSGNVSNVQIGASQSNCAGNVIAQSLYVNENSGQVSVYGNYVTRTIEAEENKGPLDISGNNLLGDLDCRRNRSLTGNGNSANLKLGQCSTL